MRKKNDDAGKPPKRGLSSEDQSLWNFVTRSIRPLSPRRAEELPAAVPAPQPTNKPVIPQGIMPGPPAFRLKEPLTQDGRETGGIDRRTLEKLRRGQMRMEAYLDLHGLRQHEAQGQLTRFLTDAHHAGRRCVLVITGKGSRNPETGEEGVLRRMVPHWLDMPPLSPIILSHCPAKQKDGGDGAVYVLLRRKR